MTTGQAIKNRVSSTLIVLPIAILWAWFNHSLVDFFIFMLGSLCVSIFYFYRDWRTR